MFLWNPISVKKKHIRVIPLEETADERVGSEHLRGKNGWWGG